MPYLSRKDFAMICDTTTAIIHTNVARKKINTVPGNKKLIDTDDPLNKIFKKNSLALSKQNKAESKAKAKRESMKEAIEDKKEKFIGAATFKEAIDVVADDLGITDDDIKKVFSGAEMPKQTKARAKQHQESQESVDWDLRKKIADAQKAELAAEKAQLDIEKLMGKLMPVDLVETILKVNIQDIFKTFENELINLASIYCDILAGGDRERLSEIIKKIRLKLAETIERVEISAAQEIENVVESYAEVRNRGEKK